MDRMSVVKDGVDIDEVDQEQHLNDEIRMRHCCSGYIISLAGDVDDVCSLLVKVFVYKIRLCLFWQAEVKFTVLTRYC